MERVQKAALKVILRSEYKDYEDALRLTGLQSLDKRREMIGLRFVKNSLKNVNFSKLFPLKRINHVMNVRNPLKYQINKANTERYRRSTIPYLQGLLNKEYLKRRAELNDLQTFKHVVKRTHNSRHGTKTKKLSLVQGMHLSVSLYV